MNRRDLKRKLAQIADELELADEKEFDRYRLRLQALGLIEKVLVREEKSKGEATEDDERELMREQFRRLQNGEPRAQDARP